MRIFRLALAILFVACSGRCVALSGAPVAKRLQIIGKEKGYRYQPVYPIRTDTETLTKKKLEYKAKNLNDFGTRGAELGRSEVATDVCGSHQMGHRAG